MTTSANHDIETEGVLRHCAYKFRWNAILIHRLQTRTSKMAPMWDEIAAAKREALSELIPPEYRIPQHLLPPAEQLDVTTFPRESGWFSQKELDITDSTATHILDRIATQEWTSEEVTKAFCKRAAAAHQLVSKSDIEYQNSRR